MVLLCELCSEIKTEEQILKCLNSQWIYLHKVRGKPCRNITSFNELIVLESFSTLNALLEANILENFIGRFCQSHPFAVHYFHLDITKSLKLWNHL